MDLKSENIKSGPLSSNYPSYYKEFQLRNLTPLDLVVTEADGTQFPLLANKSLRESEACVEIEYRSTAGTRSEITEFGTRDIAIDGKKIVIPFELIRNSPYRMMEFNIIISTVDHAYVAKQMLTENSINPIMFETRVDEEILDPRLVFQVVDPCNRWEVLFVNVFGQTVILRAGHWSQLIPDSVSSDSAQPLDPGKLVCYLRYPNDYYTDARALTTVFEVTLDHVDDENPTMIPGGDTICIASTMEGLQRVLAKKASGNKGAIPGNMMSTKMVPKDVFDNAQKMHEQELERVKQEAKTKLETANTNKNSEIAKLTYDKEQLEREVKTLKQQVANWEAIDAARTKIGTSQAEVDEAVAKSRKEAYEASRKDLDNMWNVLKIAGTIATGVLSYVITSMAKSKK